MGWLFDARTRVDRIIDERKLDPVKTRGNIGLKAGFLLSLINPNTPDDPKKQAALKTAVKDVLGVDL